MKYLIILITVLTTSFIVYGQEYKVVCKRITGCPVVNGTCPTCIVIRNKNEPLDSKIDRMVKEMRSNFKKKYQPDISKSYLKPSGWGIIRWEINEALKVRKDFYF